MTFSKTGWLCSLVSALALPGAAAAQATQEPGSLALHTLPARATLGIERLRLPDDEDMGLVGAGYLLEMRPGWWLGPALYGAATGRRGGLFTWGAEGQRRWRLDERWQLAAGLYAGGGGGAGAPVGGGLMLRPHVDLMVDFGPWATGLTASQVRFPTGQIDSVQFGWQIELRNGFVFAPPGHQGEAVPFDGRGGMGADRIDAVLGRYAKGSGRGSPLSQVGIRLERQLGPVLAGTLEARGAAKGGSDGYAEMTGGLQALWPLGGDTLRLGLHGALGLGGGGGVATGGGTLAKLGLSGRLQWNPRWSLGLEAGRARAFGGDFDTPYAQVSMGVTLDDRLSGEAGAPRVRSVHDMEWSFSLQDYAGAQRKDGSVRGLSTVGLKFRRSLGEHLYLTGQGHGAVAGGAGAYSSGLLGLGVATRMGEGSAWRAGAEAALGAAGGGGVANGGGAIAQPMAWLGHDLGPYGRLKVGAGYIKSLRGELASPVLDVSWAVAFGVP
ncbi:MAG TPA: hypothetical protein VFL86_11260 [Burkholderiaceae bacterium]|nr:hypothetical protein [Burkholderiaceae bacterium]